MYFFAKKDKNIACPKLNIAVEKKILKRLENIAKKYNTFELKLTKTAQKLWDNLYKKFENSNGDELYEHLVSRISLHTLKIAGLLAVFELKEKISVKDLKRAVSVSAYLLECIQALRETIGKSELRKIEDKICQILQENSLKYSKRDLQQAVRGKTIDAGKFNSALKNLIEAGVIEIKGGIVHLLQQVQQFNIGKNQGLGTP